MPPSSLGVYLVSELGDADRSPARQAGFPPRRVAERSVRRGYELAVRSGRTTRSPWEVLGFCDGGNVSGAAIYGLRLLFENSLSVQRTSSIS